MCRGRRDLLSVLLPCGVETPGFHHLSQCRKVARAKIRRFFSTIQSTFINCRKTLCEGIKNVVRIVENGIINGKLEERFRNVLNDKAKTVLTIHDIDAQTPFVCK